MKSYPLATINYPLVILVGPTASGKSELAVKLAKLFNGEIISADSRQIYKGMDLGTGKVAGKWVKGKYCYKSISHHLIDFLNPSRQYSAAQFQKQAKKAIADICKRGKLPIFCGGTGHWIDAVVYDQQIPDVKPNPKLRAKLDNQSAEKLFASLKKLDPHRAATIDPHNKRRLIRALEIVISTGKAVPSNPKTLSPYNPLWLGIKTNQTQLYQKIDKRLKQRLNQGIIKEVKSLRKKGLSWKRLESFGLEYKFIALHLQNKITYNEMLAQLSFAIKHYSKRQLTWWRRNKKINWITKESQAEQLVAKFLKK